MCLIVLVFMFNVWRLGGVEIVEMFVEMVKIMVFSVIFWWWNVGRFLFVCLFLELSLMVFFFGFGCFFFFVESWWVINLC